ncbi:MAG: site-2 protease family protein [Acidobacteriota bacterium]|nr:site-2 protease family protein [Acidobacteriota bacterium]
MARPRRREPFKWSVPLGRVLGIPISVHVSFFLLVALVISANRGTAGMGWVNASIWIVLVFACVTIHELAHSVTARAKGAHVRSIVLLPIGGISRIESMPERWADEFWVAIAGPLASVGLGVIAAASTLATGGHLLPVDLVSGALLPRLAWVNLALAAFNLLPAFPLDGGRVLRAALERRHDVETATRLAARAGRVLAVALGAVGFFWDVWLILIAVFIFTAATQEQASTSLHVRLSGHQVGQLMRRPVVTLDARQRLGSLTTYWTGFQVVTSDGRYVGLADGRDLMSGDADALVGDFTDREAPVLELNEDIGHSALDHVVESGYPLLAVVDGGVPVGVLLLEDIARWLASSGPVGPSGRPS